MAWGKNGTPDTLGSAGDVLEITDLTANTFNVILRHAVATGNVDKFMTFNSDTGSKYAQRQQFNGTEATAVSQVRINNSCQPLDEFAVGYMFNVSGEEKIGMIWSQGSPATGAGSVPSRKELVFKYVPSPDADVTIITDTKGDTGQFDTDSNLSVLGSDITPAAAIPALTNVQDNSLFIEPSTGKRYWFDEATAVTEETLDSTNGTTDWNVTNGGSDITIDSTNKEIDITGTGQKSGYYDLGASVSASAWVLRFKIASSGSPSGNPLFWVGMFDVNTIDSRNTNVDGISLMMYTGSTYKLSMKNGSHMDSGGSQTNTSPTVSADTTTRYVEIVRNGSNAILTFYDSDTYTTSIGTCTVAITGTSFRYLCAISYFEGSGRTYSLSNVKFYNGVTSATPATWTMNPTIEDDLTTNNGWVFPTNSSYDSTNDQINLTIASNSFDVSYIDLQKAVYFGSGNNLDDDKFIIRARITKNNDLGNTSKGSSLLLQVSSALTDSSKSPNPQDAVGMRIDTDRTGGANYFYVHSTDNGTFWTGESSGISYSWGTGDLYWEIIGDGTNVTGELFTGSDYSTGSLGKVTTSQQSPTGMRYLKFCGFNDPSRTATQFSLQDFKIWNGVTTPN